MTAAARQTLRIARTSCHWKRRPPMHVPRAAEQTGMTLVELLVSVALGLLIISIALSSVLVARSLSSTTAEVSQMQQKAAYAFRIIGQQVRQAGSRNLRTAHSPTEKAAFIDHPQIAVYRAVEGQSSVSGISYPLAVAFQNTRQRSYPLVNGALQERPLHSNCLGELLDDSSHAVKSSRFALVDGNLVCAGSGDAQPIISGVEDFTVKFMLQETPAAHLQAFSFGGSEVVDTPSDWSKVYAVKVCLELVGSMYVDTAGATYVRCNGESADRGNRLRTVFRNTFHIHNRTW